MVRNLPFEAFHHLVSWGAQLRKRTLTKLHGVVHRRSSATPQRASLAQIYVVASHGGSWAPRADVLGGLQPVDVGGDLVVQVSDDLEGGTGNQSIVNVKKSIYSFRFSAEKSFES